MAGLSIRAYSRHRGVSHTAVRKALASGRIHLEPNGTIDPLAADQDWATRTDLAKPRNSVLGVPKAKPATASVPRAPASEPEGEFPSIAAEGGAARLASSYAASRAAREAYLARLAKLEFEERSGKLVDADAMRAQIFRQGRRIRDALLGLPDRLAPVLIGQVDQAIVHRMLMAEIMTCLDELSSETPAPAGPASDLQP